MQVAFADGLGAPQMTVTPDLATCRCVATLAPALDW